MFADDGPPTLRRRYLSLARRAFVQRELANSRLNRRRGADKKMMRLCGECMSNENVRPQLLQLFHSIRSRFFSRAPPERNRPLVQTTGRRTADWSLPGREGGSPQHDFLVVSSAPLLLQPPLPDNYLCCATDYDEVGAAMIMLPTSSLFAN